MFLIAFALPLTVLVLAVTIAVQVEGEEKHSKGMLVPLLVTLKLASRTHEACRFSYPTIFYEKNILNATLTSITDLHNIQVGTVFVKEWLNEEPMNYA